MADQPYPIHPKLDELIQQFKNFKNQTFPRGMPAPVDHWKPLLQQVTKFEAKIIKLASDYMGGSKIAEQDLQTPSSMKEVFSSFRSRGGDDDAFYNELREYRDQIEVVAQLAEDCIHELGNPCSQYRLLEDA
ncbi:MAG: hypothetical protein H7A33_07425 [Deltaproteobacteria bacterium]|nr:hypothetical protein [Deltaproteobacteria bacterium]